MSEDKVFETPASSVRSKVLTDLSTADLTAGEIAARLDISKPSISKHPGILENASPITPPARA